MTKRSATICLMRSCLYSLESDKKFSDNCLVITDIEHKSTKLFTLFVIRNLFHSHTLGQIPRLIHIQSSHYSDVVRKNLSRDHGNKRC